MSNIHRIHQKTGNFGMALFQLVM